MTREKAMEILSQAAFGSSMTPECDIYDAIRFALADMKEAQLREQGGRS